MADEELPPSGDEIAQTEDVVSPDDFGAEATDDDISPEALAAELGWSPKDKWRGDPDEWKPAASFLKTTVEINKSRGREIKSLNERLDRIARTTAQITDQALERQRGELETKYREAVDENDYDAARKIGQKIDALKPDNTPDPEVRDFVSRNGEWYNVDPDATAIAFNVAQRHADQGKSAAEQLEAAEAAVRKRFPEYFKDAAPRAKQPASVELSGSRAAGHTKRGPKGFNDLPPEAKTAALDFEKRGRTTKDEYAKLYWQENA